MSTSREFLEATTALFITAKAPAEQVIILKTTCGKNFLDNLQKSSAGAKDKVSTYREGLARKERMFALGYPLKYRISHLALRLIATVNIAHLFFATISQNYFLAAKRFFHSADVTWMIVSSIVLPLYVLFEIWWMRGTGPSPAKRKELLLDTGISVVWFLICWGFVLYSWTHVDFP
jgi:hypothetical protein